MTQFALGEKWRHVVRERDQKLFAITSKMALFDDGETQEEAFPARAVGLRRRKLTGCLPFPTPTATARPWRHGDDSSPRGHRGMGRAWSGSCSCLGFSANSVVATRGGHTLLGKVRFVLLLAPLPLLFLFLFFYCFFFLYSLLCSIDSSTNKWVKQVSIAPDIQNKIIVVSEFFLSACSGTRVSVVVVVVVVLANLQQLLKSSVLR